MNGSLVTLGSGDKVGKSPNMIGRPRWVVVDRHQCGAVRLP
jgi:hypothetical protein